jgi:hypothetical protein
VITGAAVPEPWYEDFQKITAPLVNVNTKWPFKLEKALPRAHATSPGGSDHTSFEMREVPTLQFRTQTDYVYPYAWHTLNDLYSELVPYAEHQQHSALVTAVVVHGVANLEKPLTRAGVYLPDGLYASILVGAPDKPIADARQLMVSVDYQNAPLQAANFVRIVEGNAPQPAAGGRGGFGGPGGGAAPAAPPIGSIQHITGGFVNAIILSPTQKTVALAKALPKVKNPAVKHDGPGVFGVSSNNSFYLTLKKQPSLDGKYTALGKVVAGTEVLPQLQKGEAIRAIRITRVGDAARNFKTDDEAFKQLLSKKQ